MVPGPGSIFTDKRGFASSELAVGAAQFVDFLRAVGVGHSLLRAVHLVADVAELIEASLGLDAMPESRLHVLSVLGVRDGAIAVLPFELRNVELAGLDGRVGTLLGASVR